MGLAVVGLAVAGAEAVAVDPGEDAGEEEHDAVHDAEGEAGLEHGAGLVDVDVDADVDADADADAAADILEDEGVARRGTDVMAFLKLRREACRNADVATFTMMAI